jgi:hypothetical protein
MAEFNLYSMSPSTNFDETQDTKTLLYKCYIKFPLLRFILPATLVKDLNEHLCISFEFTDRF